jgi:prepilin-type N-terminal cleavage/methylation domain-containing protein
LRILDIEVKNRGFSLIEVLLSVLIIATVIIVLLARRNAIIEETHQIKIRKDAWVLVAQKIAEIEMEEENFKEDESVALSGEFENAEDFVFDATIEENEFVVSSDESVEEEDRTKKLFLITLRVANTTLGERFEPLEVSYYIYKKKDEKK